MHLQAHPTPTDASNEAERNRHLFLFFCGAPLETAMGAVIRLHMPGKSAGQVGSGQNHLRESAKASASIISTPFACEKMAVHFKYHCQFPQSGTPQEKSSALRK
jgi:hypothetical protein